nr:MAG TPA: hypothetical protein [Caudoviricetes sp.]
MVNPRTFVNLHVNRFLTRRTLQRLFIAVILRCITPDIFKKTLLFSCYYYIPYTEKILHKIQTK